MSNREVGERIQSRRKLPDGYRIERVLRGWCYPRNGNLHNPTPRYVWESFAPSGRLLAQSSTERAAAEIVRIDHENS